MSTEYPFSSIEVFSTAPPTTVPPPTQPAPTTQPPEIATTVIPTLAPCEYPVQLRNVAQGKTATQTSTKKDATADRAVDGNKNGDMETGQSCSQTDREYEPHWTVDLGQSYDIYEVDIFNRQDCCGYRIKHSQVRVGDSPNPADNPVCGFMIRGSMYEDNPIIIRCGCDEPMKGRYVTVEIVDKDRPLTLCEVEVLAG
ncbi:fucolectin-1-like [Glandiceps talaboti]